jgi:predicted sugar kinase
MATVYSTQKTKWDQDSPKTKIKTSESAGRVRVSYADYTAATEQSDIHMFNLPNGARILSMQLVHVALGSTTTLSVGHAAYNNSAGTAVALDVDDFKAAAASTGITTVGAALTAALKLNSIVDADEDGIPITVSLAGANGSGKIELTCTWVVD